jgi:hypothetical protein
MTLQQVQRFYETLAAIISRREGVEISVVSVTPISEGISSDGKIEEKSKVAV